jgi:NAD-dependent deacetylase
MKKRVVVLTGAGISAESGIKTFRDANGLWEGHDVMEVASPEGWRKNPALVLDFYNQRRRQLLSVLPNEGHLALVALEEKYEVTIITQNVDDLHERAGSSHIIHLHGELRKVRSSVDEKLIFDCEVDINIGEKCPLGSQLRPHIVWFGENVPLIGKAYDIMEEADYVLIIGTSMQVYPAAGLYEVAPSHAAIWYIDKHPAVVGSRVRVIAKTATEGVPKVVKELLKAA